MAKGSKKKPSARALAFSQFLRSVGDRPIDAAKKSDVPYTTIHSFVSGKTQAMTVASEAALSEAYGLSPDEIFGGQIPDALPPVPASADAVLIGRDNFWPIPVFDIRAHAGAGALVVDGEPDTYQVFRDQFIRRVTRAHLRDLSVITVGGDSMEPTLREGDSILVDRSINRVVKDGIYVLRFEGELLVKRCQRHLQSGTIMVSSDNELYKPFEIDEARILDVIGRVIWIGRALG